MIGIIASSVLTFSWLDYRELSPSKYRLISELTELERFSKIKTAKYRIALIGTSLTRNGFSSDSTLSSLFLQQKKSIEVIKVTVAAASSTELEPAIIKALESDVDLIIIESNPWTLSFGSGYVFTHHRRWTATRFLDLLNISPKRFNQFHGDNKTNNKTADLNSLEKFIGFRPQLTPFSSLLTESLRKHNNKIKKLRFFYPNWSNKVAEWKGKAWQLKLSKTQHRLSKETGILFLPNIPSLPAQAYSDHVHANKVGTAYYDQWLLTYVGELLK